MKKYLLFYLFGALLILALSVLGPANQPARFVAARRSASAHVDQPRVEADTQPASEDVSAQVEEPVQSGAEPEPTPEPHAEDPPGEECTRTLAQARSELWQILLRTESISSIALEGSASDRALHEAVQAEGHATVMRPKSTVDPIH